MDETQSLLTSKISKLRQPLHQLKINYFGNRGKNFTEEEDRFMVQIFGDSFLLIKLKTQLVMLEKYGYTSENVYENIRSEIKKSPIFRFDWFFKSRSSIELGKRCQSLIQLLHKEVSGQFHAIEDDLRKTNSAGRAKGRGRGRGQAIVKL